MLYDPTTALHLKPWLVRTLEPICDAEPGALADYILALLKHSVPENEMRKELSSQLEEFLEKEGPSFIDTLFTVLRTKSYLPYSAASPSHSYPSSSNISPADTGIPIPLDSLIPSHTPTSPKGQKRNFEHDVQDGRPPAKGPRINADGQFSRYSNPRDSRSTGAWSGRHERNETNGMNGVPYMMGQMNNGMMNGRRPQNYQPPDQRRGICRDYHNNGYCARGSLCKYSHGDDAFVPSQLFPMNNGAIPGAPMPFMPMFANGGMPFGIAGQGVAYDPHEARMDMRPNGNVPMGGRGVQQRAPVIPRAQQGDGSQHVPLSRASGELPVIQDLTPQSPRDGPSSASQVQRDSGQNGLPHHPVNSSPPSFPTSPMEVDMSMAEGAGSQAPRRGGFSGPSRGGRGRGIFSGDAHSFRPERRNDKTLVVEKIPEDKLSLDAVNGWFKRFGTVTNVAIDARNAKALVSFSNHEEAHAAWKSEDAVFSNRFVKLFWHRPMEGHGTAGARMLAASAPLVASIMSKESTPAAASTSATAATTSSSSATPARKPSAPSAAALELAAKQKLLEQQIAEQKSLMASLESASPEEKKHIMARLRKLGEEMKPSSTSAASSVPETRSLSNPTNHNRASSAPQADGHQLKERERLDKELEMHAATTVNTSGESTEDLKAKLAKLKEEAASLGLSEAAPEVSYGGSYRPYRGRGRGARSFYRGAARGGAARTNMKLDNRPRKLFIKGVQESSVQALRDWYETTGQLDSVERSGDEDVIVSFKTRLAAEQGLSKGQDIPSIGHVHIAWHTGAQSNGTSQSTAIKASPQASLRDEVADLPDLSSPMDAHASPHPEEEVIASGWGNDGDEDGMGMF
ncbi:hypothetical protein BJ138DRAFT_1082464 [Hygrophoropsis aurantiaca]|uniref:Uncharacterized protein n=1 Tax=Hygrophoropsis aurantiaca TaxID=72124 RepID=A0ACB8AJT4_9AGAM|nr:hypothetical protein BJ138DRAFT_1082464 [Hygrophoropsis aurantiaca]